MNALTTTATSDETLIAVMRDSVFPGAKPESVSMVLAYCRARGLDPLRKPVHIVPMWVANPRKREPGQPSGEMRDVIMPGIASYRIDAARTGTYAGKSEPEFGPMVAYDLGNGSYRVPEWCKVTVRRLLHGTVCEFTATEYWIENYATAGKDTDTPNAMWAKRPRGQLAKCAEAQALRMAFPEETGGEPTAEEMEGKAIPPRDVPNLAAAPVPAAPASLPDAEFPWRAMTGQEMQVSARTWQKQLAKVLAHLTDADAIREWQSERGGMFAAIHESGDEGAALIADAERAIAIRIAEIEENAA